MTSFKTAGEKDILKGNKSIVMDDEKYFTFTHNNMPRNDGFYTRNKENVPDNIKFKTKAKFEKSFGVGDNF